MSETAAYDNTMQAEIVHAILLGGPTKIIGVAMHFKNGAVLTAPRPSRHHDLIRLARSLGISREEIADAWQGFSTDTLGFVDRARAARIAEKAGQRIKVIASPDTLFSEEVW